MSDYQARPRMPPTYIDTHFLSLPDNAVYTIFCHLSPEPGATGNACRDALNLAATCRGLNNFYRRTFVVALDMSSRDITQPDSLLRAFHIFPHLNSLNLLDTSWSSGMALQIHGVLPPSSASFDASPDSLAVVPETRVSITQESTTLNSRSVGIKTLSLGESSNGCKMGAVTTRCVCAFASMCRNLQHLTLGTLDAVEWDTVLTAFAEKFSTSLQSLQLSYASNLTDIGGFQISRLRCLKSLKLCPDRTRVTDATFSAMSELKDLEELVLQGSDISDRVVCSLLLNFRKLRVLNVLCCRRITSAVYSVLPRSLVYLNVSLSGAFIHGVPPSPLERVPNLTSFSGRDVVELNDLSFLATVAARLQLLCTDARVPDAIVAHWMSEMPNLAELDLSDCANVSDETALAVSRLERIKAVNFRGTKISNEGVRALAGGIACQSLEILDLRLCKGVSTEHSALRLLLHEISKKGYGKLLYPGC